MKFTKVFQQYYVCLSCHWEKSLLLVALLFRKVCVLKPLTFAGGCKQGAKYVVFWTFSLSFFFGIIL